MENYMYSEEIDSSNKKKITKQNENEIEIDKKENEKEKNKTDTKKKIHSNRNCWIYTLRDTFMGDSRLNKPMWKGENKEIEILAHIFSMLIKLWNCPEIVNRQLSRSTFFLSLSLFIVVAVA